MTAGVSDPIEETVDPCMIDLARVIAEKYEHSALECLETARYWDREAELYARLPAYRNYSTQYAQFWRRYAREEEQTAERSRQYIARAASTPPATTAL